MRSYLLLSIPTIIVTLLLGFWPWGALIAIATPVAMIAIAALVGNKRMLNLNIQTALEGLSYGRLPDAEEHLKIALREAEDADKLDEADWTRLSDACEKVAQALSDAGKQGPANALLRRCAELKSRGN